MDRQEGRPPPMDRSTTAPDVPLKNRSLAAFLALLLPGLGHVYQGRTGKAILYMSCILGLYFVGFALGEGQNVYWAWVSPLRDTERFRLHYLGQFWVGLPAWPALIQATLIHYGQVPLFNGFMSPPLLDPSMQGELRDVMQEVARRINALHQKYGGLKEIGDIYTTVAGLLNILVIYDAFEGPAHQEPPEEAPAVAVAVATPPAAEGARP